MSVPFLIGIVGAAAILNFAAAVFNFSLYTRLHDRILELERRCDQNGIYE